MSSVDVVVPCYNYARYLTQAVETALNQRDAEVRVLIIDDVSSDETPEVGQRLAANDARVTYTRNEKNLGLIGTANKGILGWVAADYYILLSADDALAPGAFARAAAVMNSNADVNIVYGRAALISDGPLPPVSDDPTPTYQLVGGPEFIRRNCEHGNPAPSPAVILRTSTQKKLGGYNPKLKHTSDMEMWMRFAAHGPVGVIKETQAYYRLHGGNMSEAFNMQVLRDREEIIETCEVAINEWCRHIPEAQAWLRDLKRRFADEAYWLAGKALEAGDPERMRARLAFANAQHPSPMLSNASWRFHVKRALGGRLARALRKADLNETPTGAAGTESGAYQSKMGEIGWWPETT
jgi:Glycosyl transferase family 2